MFQDLGAGRGAGAVLVVPTRCMVLVLVQMQMQMLATVPTRCMVLLSCCWCRAGVLLVLRMVTLARRIHCTRSTVPIGANRRTNQWR